MKYVVTNADMGLPLKPSTVWNGRRDFIFQLTGMSDSKYEKDDLKKSVSCWSTFLNGPATSFIRKLMQIIALSVTESEKFSAVMSDQDMLFVMMIINSIGLKFRLPINLDIEKREKNI